MPHQPPHHRGSAPSIPATTTTRRPPGSRSRRSQQPVHARPRPRRRRAAPSAPIASAVSAASSATGRSLVPAGDHRHVPARSLPLRDVEDARASRVVQPFGKRREQRLRPSPGCSRVTSTGCLRRPAPDDAQQLLGGLRLAEHHLGEPEAQAAVRVHRRVAELGEGEVLQRARCLVHRGATAPHVLEQLPEPGGVHALRSGHLQAAKEGLEALVIGEQQEAPGERRGVHLGLQHPAPLLGRQRRAIISAGPSPTRGTECKARMPLRRTTASRAAEKAWFAASRSATSGV